MERSLRSHPKQRADELASYYLGQLLRPTRTSIADRLAATEKMSLDELRAVHARTFGGAGASGRGAPAEAPRLAARSFSHGNLNAESSLALADAIEVLVAATGATVLPQGEWTFSPVVRLPRGRRWRLKLRPLCREENNSAVVLHYQLGQLRGTPEHAHLAMLLRLLRQPLFAELRTKQQLGYVVTSGAYDQQVGMNTVMGLCVQVLSRSFAPPAVQRAIDEYLRRFPSVVRALTAKEFETSRTAVVTRLREPDRTLAEAHASRWAPIEHEHLDWNLKQALAASVQATSQADVAALAEDLFAESSKVPRVSVHIFGNAHQEHFEEEDGTASTPIEDVEGWRRKQPTWPRRDA